MLVDLFIRFQYFSLIMRDGAIWPNSNICNNCGKGQVIFDGIRHEYYCSLCGIIIDDLPIDFYDRSSFFESDNPPAYSIVSAMKVNRSLGTDIGIDVAKFTKIKNRYLIKNKMSTIERNFSRALPYLQLAWAYLSMPNDLRVGSTILYRKCIDMGITNGRKTEAMIYAIVSLKCAEAHIQRSRSTLKILFELDNEEIESCKHAVENMVNIINRYIKIKTSLNNLFDNRNLDDSAKEMAIRMLDFIIKNGEYQSIDCDNLATLIFRHIKNID